MVTMDALYRYKVPVQVGEENLWMRVLSDFDQQYRDEYRMLAMVRRRKEMDDPQTQAHELYIAGLESAPDDELRGVILLASQYDAQREAAQTIKPQYFPMPDKATDEEQAEVLKKREEDAERVKREQEAYVEKVVHGVEEQIKDWERAKLLSLARARQVEQQARLAAIRAFQDATVYIATYRDENCQQKRFNSPAEVSQLPPEVRTFLVSFYFQKVDTLTQLDLQYFFSTGEPPDSAPRGNSQDSTTKSSRRKARAKSRGT